MLLECSLFLVHQPPGVNWNFSIKINGVQTPYSINMVITCISLAKVFVVLRSLFRHSRWGSLA